MPLTAIQTLRAVARRAVEDPQPSCSDTHHYRNIKRLPARLSALIAGLLAVGIPAGGNLRIIAQALTTILPLLDTDRQPTADPPSEGTLVVKTSARLDLLREERQARARQRSIAKAASHQRARPDRPPIAREVSSFAAVPPGVDIWHDLLDLTSESLETFMVRGDIAGSARCAELLDLLAEAFATDRPEAA